MGILSISFKQAVMGFLDRRRRDKFAWPNAKAINPVGEQNYHRKGRHRCFIHSRSKE